MSESAAQTSERDLLSTTDAQVWARAFMERFAGRMVSAGDVDEGLMLSWFANAIETGREAGRKLISVPTEEDDDDSTSGTEPTAAKSYFNPLRRNDSLAGRIRWLLLPWIAYAWRYRDDFDDAPNPGRWWHHCFGSACYWLDAALGLLPSGALYPPMPPVECDCDYCRGVPGAVFEP